MRETNKIMVVLQKDVPGLCSDTCLSPSPDGNGGIEIKTEAFLAVERERNPVPISFPGIKAEHEVCCSLCSHCYEHFNVHKCLCPQLHHSAHTKELHSGE
jgi:hypothetical protein